MSSYFKAAKQAAADASKRAQAARGLARLARHAGCADALLGWWGNGGGKGVYAALAAAAARRQAQDCGSPLAVALRRLRAHEAAAGLAAAAAEPIAAASSCWRISSPRARRARGHSSPARPR